MTITLYPHSMIYFFATLISMGLVMAIWLRQSGTGNSLLVASILALNLELFAIAVESMVLSVPQKIIWSQIEHTGYAAAPTFLLLFALRYTRPYKKLSPAITLGLWIIPLIHVILVWTNSWHHWIWTGFTWGNLEYNQLIYLHGFWFYISITYTILIILAVNFVFIRAALQAPLHKRLQYRLLMIGNLIPLFFGIVYGFGWITLPGVNIFPLASLAASLIIWLAISRYGFMNPDPIARIKLVENLPDGVIVLDAAGLIVSANPAAERLLQEEITPGQEPSRGFAQFFMQDTGEIIELKKQNEQSLFVSTHIEKLTDSNGKPIGTLLLIHDLTRLYLAELELRRQERLKAANEERQRLARNLHDSIIQSLHSLSLILDNLNRAIAQGDQNRMNKLLSLIDRSARQALREMRLVVYQWHPIKPPPGFVESLQTRLAAVENRAGLQVNLQLDSNLDVPPHWQEELSAIVTEALNNIIKHAYATSIQIKLEQDADGNLSMTIEDNGDGFDIETLPPGGMGLRNISERATLLNAHLEIQSIPAEGTSIHLSVPRQGDQNDY